ncbi:hypothetical protein Y032_0016g2946 [Ancylostoma ceylanicum]|uniref:Cation/H+ exchanger domain-containing protein n=1 Tax=Ancylostoma ceylanicum TaxID=53326 RepID=A0A016V6Z2_9BILA|nr:hypothetical protein Y032_0016g2946 [Ancylostoma ceylanicum]
MTWTTVLTGCALIAIGAVFRFLSGIAFSCCSGFNMKEQLVIALALVPKATVQASLIGAFAPLVTPIFQLQRRQYVVDGVFVLSAVRAQTGGRGGRPGCTNQSRLYTPHELHTAVDKGRDRGADTLVVCCTIRGSGRLRRIGFSPRLCPAGPLPRCSRQPECPRRGPAPCLRQFGVHYCISLRSAAPGDSIEIIISKMMLRQRLHRALLHWLLAHTSYSTRHIW